MCVSASKEEPACTQDGRPTATREPPGPSPAPPPWSCARTAPGGPGRADDTSIIELDLDTAVDESRENPVGSHDARKREKRLKVCGPGAVGGAVWLWAHRVGVPACTRGAEGTAERPPDRSPHRTGSPARMRWDGTHRTAHVRRRTNPRSRIGPR